ncbi:MAG: hypothetical protein ACK5LC_01850 [Coprobacillaceae bacterium]
MVKVESQTDAINEPAYTKEIVVTITGNTLVVQQLEALITDSKAINESLYRPSTVENLKQEVTKAEEALDIENALVTEIQEAYDNLNTAYTGLEIILDRTTLVSLLNDANAIDESLYTNVSYIRVQQAITEATKANHDDATDNEIEEAIQLLNDAITKLVKQSDYDALEAKVLDIEKENLSMYTSNSVETLNVVLQQVKGYLSDDNVTTEQLRQGLTDLQSAYLNLELKADVDSLKALVAQIESLDLTLYEEEGVVNLKTVLAEVKLALESDMNEETCKDLSQRLLSAYQSLVKKSTITPDNKTNNTGDYTNVLLPFGIMAISLTVLLLQHKKRRD